jgi:branched-subunit amino acid ABC-type transport system permease component
MDPRAGDRGIARQQAFDQPDAGGAIESVDQKLQRGTPVSVGPGIGGEMIVLSFAVVATAGLGQIEGALVAAILIGLARSFAVYLMPEVEVLVPYLIMVLVLLFRPQGLFSVAQARRV